MYENTNTSTSFSTYSDYKKTSADLGYPLGMWWLNTVSDSARCRSHRLSKKQESLFKETEIDVYPVGMMTG